MRSRTPYHVYWPQYFDIKKSRSDGRRLSKKLAIDKVSADIIAKAARQLGYKAELESNYKYPRSWFDEPGRVLIDTKGKKKSKVLIEVAKEIKKLKTKK